MKLLKRRFTDALALVLVALMGLSTFGVIEAVSVDAEPAGPTSIGTPDAYGSQTINPHMGDGCGTDIILLVDERDDIATADSNALRLAADAFTEALAGSDTRVAIVPFADRAQAPESAFSDMAADLETSATDTLGTAAALLSPSESEQHTTGLRAAGPQSVTDAAAPTTIPRASGGSNWESAFTAATALAAQRRAGAETVAVLLTAGPPTRHLIGADNESLATSAPLGIHMLEAVTAANTLKTDTRVIAVGIGQASAFRAELAAVSGHDWQDTTLGATNTDTDVLLVPSTDDATRVMTDLAADFCSVSTTLRITTSETSDSDNAGLAVENTSVAIDRISQTPVAADEVAEIDALGAADIGTAEPTVPETVTLTDEIITNEAGIAAMTMRVSGPTDLVIRPDVVTDHVTGSCTVGGQVLNVKMQAGEIVVPGVTNGDDVSCQLRVLNPDEPLVVTHHSAPGNVSCDATTPIDDSVVLSAVGGDVTHCIEVINAGDELLDDIEIDSDVTSDEAWDETTELAPGESVLRRVVATLDEASDVLTRATAATPDNKQIEAVDTAVLETLPPAMSVARGLLTANGVCDLDAPLETAVGAVVPLCYEVTNTGGTALVDITVVDEATESAQATRGTPLPLAPSETATVSTSGRLISDTASASATARPADSAGAPIAGTTTVSADTTADGPAMRVDHHASDDSVVAGEHVDFSVTVSNPGAVPLENVVVDESACTADMSAPKKLVANADSTLDPGEAWLYRCTESISEDVVAMAAASATALGEPLLSTAAARVSARRVDMTINKKSDQRLRFGDVITYRIESYSFGPDTVDNAKIIDELPPGLDFVDATTGRGSCSNSGRTVTCNIGRFEPLERIQVLIFTRITDASWVGKIIINEARVTASSPTDRVDNTDSHIDRVQASSVTTTTRRPTTLKPEDQTTITAPIPQRFTTTSASGATPTTQRPSTTTTERNDPGAGRPTTTVRAATTTTARATTTSARVSTSTSGAAVGQSTSTSSAAVNRSTSTTVDTGGASPTTATTSGTQATQTTRSANEVQRAVTTAAVNLTIAAPRAQVAATTRMANTGVNSDALFANALVFLAAGLALTGLARRRRLLF